jgi:hypothetical protein
MILIMYCCGLDSAVPVHSSVAVSSEHSSGPWDFIKRETFLLHRREQLVVKEVRRFEISGFRRSVDEALPFSDVARCKLIFG